jgi:hypothetical protein
MRTPAWRRLSVALVLTWLVALAACRNNPEKEREIVQELEPGAVAAAQERARLDLNCASVQTTILSREHGDITRPAALQRVVYQIEARGCRNRAVYMVACTPNTVCSAMTEGAGIERTD